LNAKEAISSGRKGGNICGSVMVKNTRIGLAPSSAAAFL
jgi:hypothetical protein